MSSEHYILEAYKLNYEFQGGRVYAVITPKIALQPLLNYLFDSGVIHSRPRRIRGESRYLVYVVSDEDITSDNNKIGKYIDKLKGNSKVWIEVKSLDSLDETIKGDMAYIALRQYMYKKLKFRRGPGQKLYSVNNAKKYDILNIYQAYVTNHDVIGETSYVFIDAARRLEFTSTLVELEAKYDQNTLSRIKWVKIKDSFVSFYIEPNINTRAYNNVEDKAYKALEYITWSRCIPLDVKRVHINRDDVIALIPKSSELLLELRENGYVATYGGREVVFLPKDILVPVASMDNISTLLQTPIQLKIAPTKRHEEINSLVEKLGSNIDIGNISIALDTKPLEIEASQISLEELYINSKTPGSLDIKKLVFSWNPYEKLKKIANNLSIHILYSKNDNSSRNIADAIKRELYDNLNIEPSTIPLDPRNTKEIMSCANSIAGLAGDKNCVVLFIGPSSIDAGEDSRLRDIVEKTFRFKGLFCWYISIIPKPKRGEGRIIDPGVLKAKLRVILKELAIKLQLFSHDLQPLELSRVDGGRDVFNTIVGVDTTIIGMERGQLRVGVVLMLMNAGEGNYIIETGIKPSMDGEDSALAETIKEVINRVQDARLVIYVNRAKPEVLFDYFREEEVRELLEKAVIVGATKTHTYPRILKVQGDQFANPEPTTYHHLYTKELKNTGAKLSRYLAITTTAQSERWDLTVKPTLLSIILNDRKWMLENLDRILRYTLTLCILNNTSTWIHSLPWPLHRVDRILKTAHRLAENTQDIIKALGSRDIVKTL